MIMVNNSSNSKIPRSFKVGVTRKDRISRKQLTKGLKKSLESGKKMSVATKYLRKEGEGIFKTRSFNKHQISERLNTLKEGGFLRRGVRVAPTTKKIHTISAARNKMEKTINKNIEHRKKEYIKEDRVKEDQKEWLLEQGEKDRELERKEQRRHERERLEEVSQKRLSRFEAKRTELGLGPVSRTKKADGKVDKNNILAAIRNGGTPSNETPQTGFGTIQSDTGRSGKGGLNSSPTVGGGGWSAPPANNKKGI